MAEKGEKVGNKYWFSTTVPDEVKDACRQALLDNEYLIPSWCNEVRVYWDAIGDEAEHSTNTVAAYIEASYAYRYAQISICPPFLNEEPQDRVSRIQHELCHIVSFPLTNFVRDVVNLIDENEVAANLIKRELGERVEAMTEDLAQIIAAGDRARETKKK